MKQHLLILLYVIVCAACGEARLAGVSAADGIDSDLNTAEGDGSHSVEETASTNEDEQETEATSGTHVVSSGLSMGVSHVGGKYSPANRTDTFLMAGARDVLRTGASTLKLYLTPNYRCDYPNTWTKNVASSLVELASDEAYQEVFDLPFHTFVLTTYSFAMGTGDPWRAGVSDALRDAVRAEFAELTAYLQERYAGTGKTFMLQNWEGDWSLIGAYAPEASVTSSRVQNMVRWLSARQQGVDEARGDDPTVAVKHAVEVNLVLTRNIATGLRSVLHDVIPQVAPDAVSYSAWEALRQSPGQSHPDAIRNQLRQAVGAIRANVSPGTDVYLGEFGFAENELASDEGSARERMDAVTEVAQEFSLRSAIFWQIYDNECNAQGQCRGMWVVKPDGNWSVSGQILKDALQRASQS